jgi:hypothetical protein
LTAASTAYSTPPFLPFFHPPIELASSRPRGCLHFDRRIDFATIRSSDQLHVVVEINI